jgi:hypothetical protein
MKTATLFSTPVTSRTIEVNVYIRPLSIITRWTTLSDELNPDAAILLGAVRRVTLKILMVIRAYGRKN